MIKIDEKSIVEEIKAKGVKRLLFTAPDGIIGQVRELVSRLEKQFGVQCIILGEASWGSCDAVDYMAQLIGADLAFNIGHTTAFKRMSKRTVFIDAFDDISFDQVLRAALPVLYKYHIIGLVTTSQHLPALDPAKKFLESRGLHVVVGNGRGLLRDGHVFGCEFYPVFDVKDHVNAFALLGQSMFHAVGIALSTGKPTIMLDPYMNQVVDVSDEAQVMYKKAILNVFKARYSQKFGLIIGLREGQLDMLSTIQLREKLINHGKEVVLIALRDIADDRLSAFRDIDVFILTACPRIALDDHFSKPVLSIPQAEALIGLWEGKDPGEFLQRAHWL